VAPPLDVAGSAEFLAATRLDAGLNPDSGEAHLRHALAALDEGPASDLRQWDCVHWSILIMDHGGGDLVADRSAVAE